VSYSDIKSVTKTADGSAVVGRCRLYGVYFTNTATGSSFDLKDGTTSSGTSLLNVVTPAAAGAQDLFIPDMGILFQNGIFIDVADAEVTSVTLFFEGGDPQ
jgi:hypothetical protein|tara:strand:- start:191 stop:493 length:303 start_codon:yes stop_codon:yes gene_type:complete